MKILPYAAVSLGLMLVLSAGLLSNNFPANAAKQKATVIAIDEVPGKVRPGNTVTITGMLTTVGGEPLNQVPVNIILLTSEPRLITAASGVTSPEGAYEISWDVKLIPTDKALTDVTQKMQSQVVSLFAQFDGNEQFAPSKTDKSTVTIEANTIETFVNTDKKVYKKGDVAIIFIGFVDSDDEFVDPDGINVNFNINPVGSDLEKKKMGSYTYTTPPLEEIYNQFSVVPQKEGYNIQTEVVTITVSTLEPLGPLL